MSARVLDIDSYSAEYTRVCSNRCCYPLMIGGESEKGKMQLMYFMRIDDWRKLKLDCTKAINASQEDYRSQIICQLSKGQIKRSMGDRHVPPVRS